MNRCAASLMNTELLRSYVDELSKADIGLIVCDEGHRLKNIKGNQTIHSLESLQCTKRILLTGTPVQNNLSELYAMLNFVCPGCLGDVSTFQNRYAKPIESGRSSDCTEAENRIGDQRSNALHEECSKFILRRTNERTLRQYLPPKDIHIVFHSLSEEQCGIYQYILKRGTSLLNGGCDRNDALAVITYLRMCCSCPRTAFASMTNSKVFDHKKVPNEIKALLRKSVGMSSHKTSVKKRMYLFSLFISILFHSVCCLVIS